MVNLFLILTLLSVVAPAIIFGIYKGVDKVFGYMMMLVLTNFLTFFLTMHLAGFSTQAIQQAELINNAFARYTVEEKTGKVQFVIPDTSLAKVFLDKDGAWR